jgi:hypothetical protein
MPGATLHCRRATGAGRWPNFKSFQATCLQIIVVLIRLLS